VDPARRIATEVEVMKSEPVRAAVRAALGPPVPAASVSAVGSSDVIEIRAQSTSRSRAAAMASAYATSYLEYRRSQSLGDLAQAEQKIQARISDFQAQIDALDIAARAGNTQSTGTSASRDTLVTQQALFKQRLDELRVDAELKTGGAQIVTKGLAPTTKVKPTTAKNGVLALVLGSILGVGLAFMLEFLDDSIRTKDDLERWADGTPVLGLLPVVAYRKDVDNPHLVTLADMTSPSAEAYRSLRTSLQFLGVARAPRVFQITSANPREGKTTTTANLGVVLAQAGQRVVMVDCDLRRPRLHGFAGLSNQRGFTSAFVGDLPLSEVIRPVPEVERLFVLASGALPPNQSELLASRRTAEIFAELQETFDVVLVDCPPVLPVTDASVLSAWVDATIVVVTAGSTPRSDLRRALELLRQVDAPVVGLVLNQVQAVDSYGYRYGRYETDVTEGGSAGLANGAGLSNGGPRSGADEKASPNGKVAPLGTRPDLEPS
jgi:capsular exopolysaccharide synthesis family protein